MNAIEVVAELQSLGSPATKKVLLQHGAREPFFGVKIGDLKKIQKRIKVDHALALELYDTGISDAMYLAGLVADDPRMTRKDLQRWARQAYWYLLSEYTVAWVAAGSNHGRELALGWIESDKENLATSGWATLGSLAAVRDDADLDLAELEKLLGRVRQTIHSQSNRVRHVMNGFVISVGTYVRGLTDLALQTAGAVGAVAVDTGNTECKVPSAVESIRKVQQRGTIGKKRKTAKC